MEITIRALKLKSEYFAVNGPNLERANLFNQSTTLISIDPSVVDPITSVPDAVIDSLTTTSATDFSMPAGSVLNTVWTGNGWDLSTDAAIQKQVRAWILRNLNDSSHFAVMAGKELELHTVWMQGNVEGQDYTTVFIYSGNAGPILANPLFNDDISDWNITELNGGTVTFDNGCLTLETTGTGGSTAKAAQDFDTVIGTRYHFEFEGSQQEQYEAVNATYGTTEALTVRYLNVTTDTSDQLFSVNPSEGTITVLEDNIRFEINITSSGQLNPSPGGVGLTKNASAVNPEPGRFDNLPADDKIFVSTNSQDGTYSITYKGVLNSGDVIRHQLNSAPGFISAATDTLSINATKKSIGDEVRVEAADSGAQLLASELFNGVAYDELEFIATTTTTTISVESNNLSSKSFFCPIAVVEVFGPYILNQDQSILLTESDEELMLE